MIYLSEENEENDSEGPGFQVREVYESLDFLDCDCEATSLIDGSTCICEQLELVAFIPILKAGEVVKNTYFGAMNILTQWMSNIN